MNIVWPNTYFLFTHQFTLRADSKEIDSMIWPNSDCLHKTFCSLSNTMVCIHMFTVILIGSSCLFVGTVGATVELEMSPGTYLKSWSLCHWAAMEYLNRKSAMIETKECDLSLEQRLLT